MAASRTDADTVVQVGGTGGAVTSSTAAAAAISPGLVPAAHASPARKQPMATTTMNGIEYADVDAPTSTASPMAIDTPTTRGIRPCGLSCRAVAPAMVAAPAAAMAAVGPTTHSPIAAITSTPSKLRPTAPKSGTLGRSARPLITATFLPRPRLGAHHCRSVGSIPWRS
jgi:hypothetical protein